MPHNTSCQSCSMMDSGKYCSPLPLLSRNMCRLPKPQVRSCKLLLRLLPFRRWCLYCCNMCCSHRTGLSFPAQYCCLRLRPCPARKQALPDLLYLHFATRTGLINQRYMLFCNRCLSLQNQKSKSHSVRPLLYPAILPDL